MRRAHAVAIVAAVAAAGIAMVGLRRHHAAPAHAVEQGPAAMAHVRTTAEVAVGQATTPAALHSMWDHASGSAERIAMLDSTAYLADATRVGFLREIAMSKDPLAAHAGAAIGKIRSPRVARELLDLARSADPTLVRANAARALSAAGSKADAGELVSLVADATGDLRVRQEAALALGHIGDDASAERLGEVLDTLAAASDEPTVQLRISIIQALGGIHTDVARTALLRHRARNLSDTERAFVDRALMTSQPAS